MLKSTTVALKPADVDKKWIVIDAEGVVVGRLATFIANRLRGKHLPTYTPHVDLGDHVIVVNADKVVFTGKKLTDKIYYRHTGHPGGIKSTTPQKVLNGRFPSACSKRPSSACCPRKAAGPSADDAPAHLRRRHPHPRSPAAGNRRLQVDVRQELPEHLSMTDVTQDTATGFDALKGLAADNGYDNSAPVYVQKLDAQGRAYSTGKRKNAIARVWVKPAPASSRSTARIRCSISLAKSCA